MQKSYKHIETKLIHSGEPEPLIEGAVAIPVFQSATTSHSGLNPEERRALGISDTLIRLSVGLESTEEIIQDFDQALKA